MPRIIFRSAFWLVPHFQPNFWVRHSRRVSRSPLHMAGGPDTSMSPVWHMRTAACSITASGNSVWLIFSERRFGAARTILSRNGSGENPVVGGWPVRVGGTDGVRSARRR
jgi:hypothetical protein